MSLRAAAAQAAISASLLSQVETGKVQPSVSTLYAIVGALGITVDDVLASGRSADAPSRRRAAASPVQRSIDAPEIVMENGVTWRRLAAKSASDGVDALLVSYQPGAASSLDGSHMRHVGAEWGYLIRGELTLKLDFETYIVRAGDSLAFDPSRPHLYINNTDAVAEGVWFVVGLPREGDEELPEPGSVRNAVDVLDALGRMHSRTAESG